MARSRLALAAAAAVVFLGVSGFTVARTGSDGEPEASPAPSASTNPTVSTEPPAVSTTTRPAPSTLGPTTTRERGFDTAEPTRVRIPGIGVDADIVDLGLNLDGSLEVPTDFDQTGWYTGRSVPGEPGPSVVVGHVDSWTGPAVFIRLDDLEAGQEIEIDRTDGRVARFRVTSSTLVDKDEFPTVEVYGPTEEPTLRLITCGGDFDGSARSYEGNLIVFAEFVGLETPPEAPTA